MFAGNKAGAGCLWEHPVTLSLLFCRFLCTRGPGSIELAEHEVRRSQYAPEMKVNAIEASIYGAYDDKRTLLNAQWTCLIDTRPNFGPSTNHHKNRIMQFVKSILIVFITIACFGTATAQQADKMEAKAKEKVTQFEQQILKGDASQGLTDEQRTAAVAVFTQMFTDVRAAKKEGGEADAIKERQKAIRKAAMKKVNMEIFTKEQRLARRAGKE